MDLKEREKAAVADMKLERRRREMEVKKMHLLQKEVHDLQQQIIRDAAEARRVGRMRIEERQDFRQTIANLLKQARRAKASLIRAKAASKTPKSLSARIRKGRSYTWEARQLARDIVEVGCARSRVGTVIEKVAKTFGVEIKSLMSERTVSRAILEGGIASQLQLAYEWARTGSITISADSTSHRKQTSSPDIQLIESQTTQIQI